MFRFISAGMLALGFIWASAGFADDIDDCHAALEAGDRSGAMMMAQTVRIFAAPTDRTRQLRALDCLHASLDDTFLVVDNKFMSSTQVAAQMEELSAARVEMEDLKAIVESADPALLTSIALSEIDIIACLADDLVLVVAFKLDKDGNRISLLTDGENDAEVYSGDRVTLVRGDTVTIIDGARFHATSGDTEFKGSCRDIEGEIIHLMTVLPKLDWDQLYD